MRIGFDVSQTGRLKGGCGYFADSLIRGLSEIDRTNEYLLYPTFGNFYFDPEWRTATVKADGHRVRRGLAHGTPDAARAFWSRPPDDLEAQLGHPDVIHANNFFCPTTLRRAKLVYTLYDLSFLEQPEWTTEANRTGCFDGVFNASLYADRIIAISAYSRGHFLQTFPHYPSEHVVVVPSASRFVRRAGFGRPKSLPSLQPDGFWLSVGTLEPRKNQRRLLRAYAGLRSRGSRILPMVLAGGQGWMMDDFDDLVAELGLKGDLILTGYVSDDALQWLYENCFVFVYPSLFEGFGLPVLEAMTCGAPVITSTTTSLPEIVGTAGVLVDPLQEDAITAAMRTLSADEGQRQTLRRHGLEQAASFSWRRTAEQVRDVYQELGAAGREGKEVSSSREPMRDE
jgi:glycosyltransferase involved in cell wall biosynthesis